MAQEKLAIDEMPGPPARSKDLFVAVEYAVDEFNNFSRIVRVYLESEVGKRIVRDRQGRATQILELRQQGQ